MSDNGQKPASRDEPVKSQFPYVFRVTPPVGPFCKTVRRWWHSLWFDKTQNWGDHEVVNVSGTVEQRKGITIGLNLPGSQSGALRTNPLPGLLNAFLGLQHDPIPIKS